MPDTGGADRSGGPRAFLAGLRARRYREVAMTAAAVAVVLPALVLFPGPDRVFAGLDGAVAPPTLLALLGVAVAAATVKGTVGFGSALVATPVFASVIDPTAAVVVLTVMPWMINVFQIGETRTGLAYVRGAWPLVGLAVVGTVLGVGVLATVRAGPLVPLLMAALVLGYVAFELATDFVAVEGADAPAALAGVGLVQGFLVALANMGPLLPAYLHTFERDTERYVGGLSMVFAVIHSTRLVGMAATGLLTPYRLWLGSAIATVSVAGLLAGTALRRLEFDQSRFDRAVTAVLFVVGLNLLRRSVAGLVG